MKSSDAAFVPAYLIRSARLRTGDVIEARRFFAGVYI